MIAKTMRFLLFLALVTAAVAPFVSLRRPWAVNLWRRVRLLAIIYAVIILVAAIVRLAFNWSAIYG